MKESVPTGQPASDPDGTLSTSRRDASEQVTTVSESDDLPEAIARYRIERILGQGGFGVVYLARDDQLQRLVTIKVPHRTRVDRREDAAAYLTEARAVASLDHPHIVPVHDVGSTEKFPCFVVSKYIDGTNLATRIKQSRLAFRDIVELVAIVAEALHHAHRKGLVHRDVKPANILLDTSNQPYVADFGLALKEADFGRGDGFTGTPAYMSPEQARGEGHRVDGRSDIFSLGIVFYELLTGRRPFLADSRVELLEQIASVEVRPPRQVDDAVPKELERICLKALSKRATERYTTAKDLADDLRHYLTTTISTPPIGAVGQPLGELSPATTPSDRQLLNIVPKGLRSYDARDADFFLEMLPGPRDREGLPDSLRFWKGRVEETDADNTFSVGLIYGPSGSGKSSLVKAGLLPRLSAEVVSVYLEATVEGTETRLLHGLRKRCPELPDDLSLTETLATLRREQSTAGTKKVLILLDQFEQWLHARQDDEQSAELVQALRQCDGERVQCIVMVRDDFWMAATRFMRALECRLLEGENSAAVDLFPIWHAEKVLAAFGRAFGALPENLSELNKEQKSFLTQSVAGLAQDGKVICIRLALFAEMMKGKAWTPASLKAVGGTAGVGISFLEETFSAATAPPEHRYHQRAARAILAALLPHSGTDIKGYMQSEDELLEASGYQHRPQDFADLIRILDSEIRLITPTDPEGKYDSEMSAVQFGGKYYQLTHDYLVPSLRDWLTRKQQETRRGRAELLLADRSAAWNARPEQRQLPSLVQWFQIARFTQKKSWTEPQRKMMRAARRMHSIRSVIASLVLLAVVVGGATIRNIMLADRASTLVEAIMVAPPQSVAYALERLTPVRAQSVPILRQRVLEESRDSSQRLHAAVALASFGEPDVPFLVDSIPQALPGECTNILAALRYDAEAAIVRLRTRFAASTELDDRSRLAVVSLHLGELELAQQMLALAPDPSPRTVFIHNLRQWRADLAELAHSLETSKNADFLSGISQSVGRIPPIELTARERQVLGPALQNLYANSPHGSTHSAARWALQQWKIELPKPGNTAQPQREWYVNSLGMTFVTIAAGGWERHAQDSNAKDGVLPRDFWLGDCEVTRRQFETFTEDPDCSAAEKPQGRRVSEQFDLSADHPANYVSWNDAVLFCNWLSRREGLAPYYEGAAEKLQDPIWTADKVSRNVQATGYRLPVEAEWEYACRARSATDFCCGDGESLLAQYSVYLSDQSQPVSSRQPNGWGLFDMHGNLWEWIDDWSPTANRGQSIDLARPAEGDHRVLRGGSFRNHASDTRSVSRIVNPPVRAYHFGFRLARTVSPDGEQN